jgi:serine kinase of HPr protein (carbohydrate metabolism regulator)
VLVGARAVLIEGPSGSGKSQLAWALLEAAQIGALPFARLVADDRAEVEPMHGRLLARPTPAVAGLIEVRGLGIRRMAYEPVAAVGLIVDLGAPDAGRLPDPAAQTREIEGITLPRLAAAAGLNPLPMVLSYLRSCEEAV